MHVIFAKSVTCKIGNFLQNAGEFLGKFCALYLFCTHFMFTWFRYSRASEEVKLLLEIQQNPTSFFKWMEKSLIHVAFRKNGVKSFPTEHFSSFSMTCIFTKISLVKAVCHPSTSILVVSVKSPPYWSNNVILAAWTALPKRIYNPIMAMGFSAKFTFQLDNTKR